MKRKYVIITITIAVLVFISIIGAISMYVSEKDISIMGDGINVKLDKKLAIYDAETGEIAGYTHLVFNSDKNVFNLNGDLLPVADITLEKNGNYSCKINDKTATMNIGESKTVENQDGNVIGVWGDYFYSLYVDKNDTDKYMIIVSNKNNDCNYILVDAENKEDAKDIIVNLTKLGKEDHLFMNMED